MTMPWNDGSTFQSSAPPKMPRNPRKRTTDKIRTRWSGRNRFNPIKMRSPMLQTQRCQNWTKLTLTLRPQYQLRHVTDLVCHALTKGRVLHTLHPKSWIGPARIGMVARLSERTDKLINRL